MSVPGNHGALREGTQVLYREPHHSRKPKKRGKLGRLIRGLLVLVVVSTVAIGALSDTDPWRRVLGKAAALDLNTEIGHDRAAPPLTGAGGGQTAPITGKLADARPGGASTPQANAGAGQAPTRPADAGPGGVVTPSSGAGAGQTAPATNTPVVVGIKTLVNRTHSLPSTYVPELVRVKARLADGVTPDEKLMQPEAARALESLMQKAEEENVILYCVSGYRSYATQKWLYEYRVKSQGQAMADMYTARPGQSEHQTGLAMDVANGPNGDLSDAFGQTAEGKWLVKNAHNFGFIIRYPQGKEKTTGYNYEPWHLRYVGVEAATAIVSQGLVLEEYAD